MLKRYLINNELDATKDGPNVTRMEAAFGTLAAVTLLAALAACSPAGVVVGAGANAGTAAVQERTMADAADDAWIKGQINYLWAEHDLAMFRKLNTSVVEGKVLVTGGVRYPETRIQAIRIAWRVEGVREVIDEIQIEDTSGVVDGLRDFWITASLRKKLLFDAHVRSINYNIDTVNGVVYLTGIAYDEAELARVRGHARTVSRVRNIVSYVRLRDDAPPGQS